MRTKKGHFAKGNTFARGHGAPKGNQNAVGHGPPVRNVNALKHGFYLRWKSGEKPIDRLPPGAGAEVLDVMIEAKKLQDFCARPHGWPRRSA